MTTDCGAARRSRTVGMNPDSSKRDYKMTWAFPQKEEIIWRVGGRPIFRTRRGGHHSAFGELALEQEVFQGDGEGGKVQSYFS